CDPAVTDSTIANNKITNIAVSSQWGAGIRLSHGSSRNRIDGNTISMTGRGGILCNEGCTDLVIRENTITGSGGTGLGIELHTGCARGLIESNRVDHWISLDSSDSCAVRRNTVSDKSGIVKFAGLEAIARNCIFTDNLIDGGAQIGISVSGNMPKEYVLWARNTVKACGTWGVQLQGDSGGIAYQYFYRNKFLNTKRNDPQAMYPDQGNGFRFNANCHYISLDRNEIRDNEGDGIQLSSGLSELSFTNNVIRGNIHASISGNPGSDLEWSGNTVAGNGSNVELSSQGFSNRKPVAAFTCPAVVQPGQTVSFSNRSYDPDGSIGHVLWDFDDGLPATDRNPTHAYSNTGSHTVTLVVWDNLGRGMLTTKTITVTGQHRSGQTIRIRAPRRDDG
ncbi:PKD domain-containing protein, partial [bacterium]